MAVTLLVQLRPGLIRLVRWAAASGRLSWPDAVDEVRAVFFEAVCRHQLSRRPTKIAANLVLDTRQRLTRSLRPSSSTISLARGELGCAEPWTGQTDPLARLLATGALREGLDRLPGSARSRELSATIAFRAWVLDEPRGVIADGLGLAPQTVNMRLHRLKTAMRANAA